MSHIHWLWVIFIFRREDTAWIYRGICEVGRLLSSNETATAARARCGENPGKPMQIDKQTEHYGVSEDLRAKQTRPSDKRETKRTGIKTTTGVVSWQSSAGKRHRLAFAPVLHVD